MLRGCFLGEKRIIPAIFRGQISPCGIFWGKYFSTGIDLKGVINNLQDFRAGNK
jgi:hypothetical protein